MNSCRGVIVTAIGTATACLALSGCGPAITGDIGVGVDPSGQPVGYVQSCSGVINGARLDATPIEGNPRGLGVWDADPPVADFSSWSFTTPTTGWRTATAPPVLRPDVVYHLMAGPKDNSGTTGYVLFTMADLRSMKPGQVRTFDGARYMASIPVGEATGSREQQERDENAFMKVITVAEFRAQACTDPE